MTMQTPQALKQQIDRTDLTEQPIEVEIEALLNHLCGNKNSPSVTLTIPTITPDTETLLLLPIGEAETSVKYVDFNFKLLSLDPRPQTLRETLGVIDKIHDDGNLCARLRCSNNTTHQHIIRECVRQFQAFGFNDATRGPLSLADRTQFCYPSAAVP